ncbi:MAG: EAL domain-containing protein [Moraxellaceae bacterium]|nr:EAL domain-containing protein [Moraxellaceae bacterium]
MSASDDHKRLQLALEAAGLDLWENDLVAGKVTHPATRTFQELGYTPQEVGDSLAFWMDILHPDDLPAVGSALEAYRDGRADNYRSEFRLRAKDGEWMWYANYGRVMSGPADAGMHRFIGVTFNIDDRKRREEELSRINQLLTTQNQQLDQMNNHLEKLSTTDPLTKLCNRRAVNERLHRLVSVDRQASALLFIDLDNFKKTNDLYGHDVGDILLCQVAQRLQSCIDASDMIARFGGDEFVLLIRDPDLPGMNFHAQLEALCTRILSLLAQPYVVGDLQLHSYGSIGVASFPEDGWTVEELTKRADIALYRAKNKGRNRYCFFRPSMETELQYQDNIETELRTALKTRQLDLLYQIQVDSNLRPVGAEALLRWHHPTRGLLSPMAFLPDAVASGLVHDIDELVLDTACAALGKWQHDAVLKDMTLAVNITARSFEHPAFTDTVIRLLDKYRLPPGRLCLELTEHIKAQSFPDAARVINRLRERGVRFALDDFGTGYSSLESLKHLAFDQIKIDAAFVADITDNPVSQAIVAGVITIANAMQIEILAECVERHEQLEHLMRRGIERHQGYLFGKPMPRSVVEATIRSAFGEAVAS